MGVSHHHIMSDMMKKGGGLTLYTPKTLIIDINSNYAGGFLGIRSVEPTLDGSLITVSSALASFYDTHHLTSGDAEYAFTTGLSKAGAWQSQSWLASTTYLPARILCVFNTPPPMNGLILNNFHISGIATENGAKDIKIYSSPNVVTNTTYGTELGGSLKMFDGVLPEHTSGLDGADDQILTLL